MTDQYDVVIVGGGMVGLTLACALGDSKLKIAVLERHAPETEWPHDFALRTSAITHASQRLFENVSAWSAMVEQRVSPYRQMHVWDAGGDGNIHFNAAEVGAVNLGYIVENRVIQAALWQRAQGLENVDVICPAAWQQWCDDENNITIQLDDGREFKTRLLVGADGARSKVREQAGIKTKGWGYDQHAIVVSVKTELSHQRTAWQRFLPNGPLAFLPMADEFYCSIVWSTTPEQANELFSLDEAAFAELLAKAFEFKLGEIVEVGERGKFPLRLQHTLDYVKPRIALIGDAAHTIHPLAGQGVNLGILDAAALAEVIIETENKGRDIGSYHNLRRYERWRKGQNVAMMASMEGFKRLFGSQFAPVKWARNAGLTLANASPLKQVIVEYAMGERGDLPVIAS